MGKSRLYRRVPTDERLGAQIRTCDASALVASVDLLLCEKGVYDK